jgi:copper type II ascorbate-dependent monooxygenase-like protein
MRQRAEGLCVVACWMALGACDGDGAGGGAILDPQPDPGGQQLTSGSYTVEPGHERYVCFTYRSPADAERSITAVTPIYGTLVHHVALFQTLVDEPEGSFDCPELVKLSWQPIWAGGRDTNGIALPGGTGFQIAAGTQYLVQYHLLNSTSDAVTERSAINLSYAADGASLEGAGIFAFGSFHLTIPGDGSDYQQVVDCQSTRQMHVFAAFPHMHKLGTRIGVVGGETEAPTRPLYSRDPWVFGEQRTDDASFTIEPGEFLRATCAWNNDTGHDVSFGESSEDEMCFLVLYYYPFEELDGCFDQ